MPSKVKYCLPVVLSILVGIGFLYLVLLKLPAYGQNSSAASNQNTLASPTVNDNRRPSVATALLLPADLNTATTENARLKYSLEWAFGGKPQRGWYLYVPLIQQLIGTERDAETPDFALAIAGWQKQAGLPLTGILDDQTLYKMIEWWQSRRLNSSIYPSSDDLLTAPISEFYDPTRETSLLQVERETYAAYKRMIAAAAKELNLKTTITGELAPDEKYLRIVSAFRSREYQAKLRAAEPNSGRAGLAVNSPHFTGHALDIYVGGEPVTTKDFNRAVQVQTPVYKWLVKNAARFGFYPYYYEPWHWEYVPQSHGASRSQTH